jgi:hypothetical protein
MISVDLARSLRIAGLAWEPTSGDRFVIDLPDLADQTYVLSDLTIDVQRHGGENVLAFNGTVEWALDSVTLDQALWLPHEDQLRTALGPAFRRLELTRPDRATVTVEIDDAAIDFEDADVSAAYGRALLHLLTR